MMKKKFKRPSSNLEFNCGMIETLGNLRAWYRKNETPEFYQLNSLAINLKCFNWEDCSVTIQFPNSSRIDFFSYEKLVELEVLENYLQEFYSFTENFDN